MGTKRRPIAAPGLSRAAAAIPSFDEIYRRAVMRKGGPDALEALMPAVSTAKSLARVPDDRVLSAMAKNIFRAGFVWNVVQNKWPDFETVFHGFDVHRCATLDASDIDAMARDARIIRNRTKIVAVRDNARFVLDVAHEHGSFGAYLAAWPSEDLVGLWTELQKRGSRLGGFTRAVFLRELGKDTFMLTGDVNRALVGAGIVTKPATSKRDQAAVQAAFNHWRAETGRPLCQLSRIMACSVG